MYALFGAVGSVSIKSSTRNEYISSFFTKVSYGALPSALLYIQKSQKKKKKLTAPDRVRS
jgi:hypothetical protein